MNPKQHRASGDLANQTIAKIEELERQRQVVERYHETKRLAELAWHALLAAPRHPVDGSFYNIAGQAWIAAEAMYAESERRRPQE